MNTLCIVYSAVCVHTWYGYNILYILLSQPEVDNFCVCLGTWGVFLDHLIMMSSGIHGGQSPPTNNHYER